MARRKPHPDPTNINPNTVRAAEVARVERNTQGAYEEIPGTAPRDARIINPLDGSQLMQENAGRIYTLFPIVNPRLAAAAPNPTGVTLVMGGLVATGTITKIQAAGNSITWFFWDQMFTLYNNGNRHVLFRLWKNNVLVTPDWLSILWGTFGAHFQPISPNAAASFDLTVNGRWGSPAFMPTWRISFDVVEIWCDATSDQQVNAFITQGNASIDFNAGGSPS